MPTTNRLEGRIAIITGGSSGIGKATAIQMASEGAKVIIAARREAESMEVVEEIRSAGGEATFIQTDVSQWEQVERMVRKTVETYGGLHIAFNNAGISARGTDVWLDVTEEQWDRMVDINLKGVWMCMRQQIPAIIDSGGGAIVNNSSFIGVRSSGSAPYTATKKGVIGLTMSAAVQFADRGVRFNTVAPGVIVTPIIEARIADNPGILDRTRAEVAMGREGTADEVASVVAWLCSDEASYVTGQCIGIDGGALAQLGPARRGPSRTNTR